MDDITKEKILKTLELSYKKAPHFSDVYPMLQKIIFNNERNLSLFIHDSLIAINKHLSITTEIIKSSSIYQNKNLRAQDKILDICTKENATEYINPIGGTELYEKEKFTKKNVALFFLKTDEIRYEQFKNKFIPGLSIIDVLMFNSAQTIQEYLKRYTLQ